MQGSAARKSLRNHVLIVLLAMGLGAILGFVYLQVSDDEYTARADVFVTASRGRTVSDAAAAAAYTQDQTVTFAELVDRQVVLRPVIDRLDLNMSVAQLSAQVRASVPLNTTIISIAASDSSAERAAQIANAVTASLSTAVNQLTPFASKAGAPVAVRSIQTAVAPSSPTSPRPLLDIGIGILAGLCVGVAVIAIADALRTPNRGTPPSGGARVAGPRS